MIPLECLCSTLSRNLIGGDSASDGSKDSSNGSTQQECRSAENESTGDFGVALSRNGTNSPTKIRIIGSAVRENDYIADCPCLGICVEVDRVAFSTLTDWWAVAA
jgi:hypothetical protein